MIGLMTKTTENARTFYLYFSSFGMNASKKSINTSSSYLWSGSRSIDQESLRRLNTGLPHSVVPVARR